MRTSPESSTATHRLAEGHDTPSSSLVPSTWVTFHAPTPPVGSVEVTTFPSSSTATHNSADGHETPRRLCVSSTSPTVQALAPPVGSVEVRTSPALLTATHNPFDGQDMPKILGPDANGGWASTRIGLAQLSGEEARAGPAPISEQPKARMTSSPASRCPIPHGSRGQQRIETCRPSSRASAADSHREDDRNRTTVPQLIGPSANPQALFVSATLWSRSRNIGGRGRDSPQSGNARRARSPALRAAGDLATISLLFGS